MKSRAHLCAVVVFVVLAGGPWLLASPQGRTPDWPPGSPGAAAAAGSLRQEASPGNVAAAQAPAVDWIRAEGSRLVDSQGRQFIPRGFVTITNNTGGGDVSYTVDDFWRMRAMGANYHALRVHAGLLGANPSVPASPLYLDRIDAIVARAKEAGLYTSMKLTVYDTPLATPAGWAAFWANQNGQQAVLINAWRPLWERYQNEPAVLGYDLLNEPEPGTALVGNAANTAFVANQLTPFYRTAIDALRAIDQRHLALFQPPKVWPSYPTPLQRPQAVYAPHYYPNLVDYLTTGVYSTDEYAPLLQIFKFQAQQLGVPLVIGEYGMPWSAEHDGNAEAEGQFRATEQLARDLMDAGGIGFTRPWFSDDQATTTVQNLVLNWAVFKGESGLSGPERTFITDVVVRPYPHMLAGTAGGFSYDPATRGFGLTYTPAAGGRTEVFVPRARHYAAGFQVRYTGGLVLAYDATSPSGLSVVANPASQDASAFAWDEARQVLTVQEWLTGQQATVEILPS